MTESLSILPPLPTETLAPALQQWVTRQWEDIQAALSEAECEALAQVEQSAWQQLVQVLAGSDYAAKQLRQHPDWLVALMQSSALVANYDSELKKVIAEITSEDELNRALRVFRHQHMVGIIWRDLNRLVTMPETTQSLSELADACIEHSLAWLYQHVAPQWGTPYSRSGEQQRMVVIGMGKLGAGELNLSSDIDLMFCFPDNGETKDGRKCLDNQTFFNRLGQKLIQVLDAITADGFVFRVDMRLRPYGKSGILCPNFDAMEEYYQDQGRDWERYALIKARVVAGDKQQGQRLMDALRPFVFRKYLDYSAFESLREMKEMINREVRRKQLQDNVKLGPGGIREIEFIAQAFQLIRGGHEPRLQTRELLQVLPLLPDAIGMPEQAVGELADSYVFLRNTEHSIQAIADQQTQELPVDELTRLRVANSVGFPDWESFLTQLQQHRDKVSGHFADTIAPVKPSADEEQRENRWVDFWDDCSAESDGLEALAEEGFDEPERALRLLSDLRNGRKLASLQAVGRERLDKLMPMLLAAINEQDNSTETLSRCLPLIEAVLRRSAYLLLLTENPSALKQLVQLCAESPWIASQITRQPILLDELLDVTSLYSPPDKETLENELRQQLLRIPEEDTEQLMNALRTFKNAHVLRVAAAEITEVLPLMKVSDYLTYIAEVVLKGAMEAAWHSLTQKHGFPQRADGSRCESDFLIVGYGKVGGIELNYESDLDLVFIHDAASGRETDGSKPIDNQLFYTRLGQRIINLLNTKTTSGQLYEVDMRLRPSGNSGLLVSSLAAFEEYQQNNAWTWEHQALVRARVLAGCSQLTERFEQVRQRILSQPRDVSALRQEVIEMRQKMRSHLGSKQTGDTLQFTADEPFQLKHDAGGIVDIEFIVQFAVLAYSHRYPELLAYTDNIRLLETIEHLELISPEDALLLRESYKDFRALTHRRALQNQTNVVPGDTLTPHRLAVIRIWKQWVEEADIQSEH